MLFPSIFIKTKKIKLGGRKNFMAPSNRVEKFRDPAKLTQKISWPAESPPARGDFSLCPLPYFLAKIILWEFFFVEKSP